MKDFQWRLFFLLMGLETFLLATVEGAGSWGRGATNNCCLEARVARKLGTKHRIAPPDRNIQSF